MPPAPYEQLPPFGRLSPRQPMPLAVEAIHPVIRIAHRVAGPLHVPQRIIFDHEFVLFPYGAGTFTLAGTAYPFEAHALFLVPPFVPHEIHSDDASPCEHLAVHFDFAPNVPAFAGSPQRRRPYDILLPAGMALPPYTQLERSDPPALSFDRLLRARSAQTPLGNLEAAAHLTFILTALLEAPTRPGHTLDATSAAKVERAVALVRDHYAQRLTTDQLASAAGLSRAHFNRLFQAWTGYPPMEYLRRHRVQVARRLLENVDLSVKEIARLTGFPDPFTFSRTFRAVDGLPPTEFRNALLAGRPTPT